MSFQVRFGEVVGMPLGTPDDVQWMRDPGMSFDPLDVCALSEEQFTSLEPFS
ncbi:hypothetical protein EV14_0678 [Prochlorococcus sp. MIT 0703]|uniref:hypothetical protein n=1 Tax=Prochlorococcus sp. MIT 0703 TaxID=1499504 RepID=UPI0005338D0F|nr:MULTISPECIES: hypothetical protein [unclassified Prochlorococcus]KGG28448.1 hypothetical protein EV12_0716 [Prochlorococcus sp. MIT 0701]KGG35885.1 hypothetical protein EV14_0678 [Prochlorococcus sp. MIT 0703]